MQCDASIFYRLGMRKQDARRKLVKELESSQRIVGTAEDFTKEDIAAAQDTIAKRTEQIARLDAEGECQAWHDPCWIADYDLQMMNAKSTFPNFSRLFAEFLGDPALGNQLSCANDSLRRVARLARILFLGFVASEGIDFSFVD